eukprot:764772-Hanusia_phi.AAC.1
MHTQTSGGRCICKLRRRGSGWTRCPGNMIRAQRLVLFESGTAASKDSPGLKLEAADSQTLKPRSRRKALAKIEKKWR